LLQRLLTGVFFCLFFILSFLEIVLEQPLNTRWTAVYVTRHCHLNIFPSVWNLTWYVYLIGFDGMNTNRSLFMNRLAEGQAFLTTSVTAFVSFYR